MTKKTMPIIIEELRDLLDPLGRESRAELKKMLEAEGQRDAIVVWKEKNAILDGHNRLSILTEIGKEPRFEMKSLPNIEAARRWIIENQLGRRNLTPDRFNYFLGVLYNEAVGDKPDAKIDGKTKAEEIGEKYGVSERTVRRAAETSKGIDVLEKIKGKIAKQEQLAGKGEYTAPELTELAKVATPKIAKKMLEKLDAMKTEKKAAKQQVKKAEKEAAKLFPVAFCQPDFAALNFNAATYPRLPLDKNAVVYMRVGDAYLANAIELLGKWGLHYDASIIFHGTEILDEGVFTKIKHEFLLIATKGDAIGPKKGNETDSALRFTGGDPTSAMIKIIELTHRQVDKLDARKGVTATGFFPLEA